MQRDSVSRAEERRMAFSRRRERRVSVGVWLGGERGGLVWFWRYWVQGPGFGREMEREGKGREGCLTGRLRMRAKPWARARW